MEESSAFASPNTYGEEDGDDYEETNGGNRLLGFMFGNVDGSGDLDVDYLDEDAKEHISALADKLGQSLTDIDLSIRNVSTPTDATEQDYDEKAEDAVDYEDIEEQYEGPEIQATSEEDLPLPKNEFFSTEVSLASFNYREYVFDEENYDEDEEYAKEQGLTESTSEVQANSSTDEHAGSFIEKVKSPDNSPSFVENFEEVNEVDNLEAFQEVGPVVQQEPVHGRSGTLLPVLCEEDGMVVLRFSEIFGIHEPLKKRDKRAHHRYPIPKDRHKSIDVADIIEEDEEAFLKGSCPGFSAMKDSSVTKDDYALRDDDIESEVFGEQRKDSCLSAQPMKENVTFDPFVGQHLLLSPRFYPLDQLDWENGIVWENSPAPNHESSESCTLSGPDSETFTNTERGVGVLKEILGVELQEDPDEKDHSRFLCSHPVSVEPFGSINSSKSMKLPPSECSSHPQILRLESCSKFEVKKINAPEGACNGDAVKHVGKLSLQNIDLLEGSWLDKILWDPDESAPRPKLILDLQDEQMLFEVLENKDGKNLRSHAGAMIISRSLKSSSGDSFELPSQGTSPVGRFNISNDKYYSNRKTSQQSKSHAKKRAVHGVKVMHSVPALKLQTMKPKLSNKDIANFHRPKALWYPHDNEVAAKEQGKLSAQGPMKIILKSMGGKGSKLHVDAAETVSSVEAKASKKLDFKPSEKVKVFYSGKELEDAVSLARQSVRPNSVLHLVRTKIHLWPKAQRLPGENKPLRPPGAFKKKSELSLKVGHVFLMEYCEERPLLLGNVGMGARLCTYYQKSTSGDQTASSLRNGSNSLGNVLTLDPADKSPFLGDIKPGCSQSSLETNMYRAPIFPHKLSSNDYLLVRSAKGKLSLRRIDKLHVVGQQEPHMEVISPGSKNLQTYMGNRLLVYVYREFRGNEKPGFLPCVRADDLSVQFPYLSESFLRKRLKHCADLQKGSNGELFWIMRRNFRIPSEEELRRMVTPESVCTYESMQAGLYRLKRLGICKLTHPATISSAMNQLPDEAIALAAASHIERELQITSWNLSSNFVACTMQGRESIERLEITGVGDPSGRCLGFSYVRVAPKAPISSAVVKKKATAARGGSAVTGTDADLRRLSMDAAREVLLKFKVPEDQIEKMTRWHRIAMVRKLSSEQAASGVKVDATTLSKFARGQRMSFLQLQQQTREKCQEIWDRQVQNLSAADGEENESDSEANSDLDSFAGDLENLLDAEECDDGEVGNDGLKRDKTDGVRGLGMRRKPSQVQAEEEIEDEAAEAAELCRMLMDDDELERKKKAFGKEDGAIGMFGSHFGFISENIDYKKTNKIVRHVIRTTQPNGSFTSKEIIISDPREVENFLAKKGLSRKVKANKGLGKNDVLQSGGFKKKKKEMDGIKVIKEKKPNDKPVRESFVCGACGQLGHMRTNKNCPKYGEELELHVDKDLENKSGKPNVLNTSTPLLPKPLIKKLVPKISTRIAPTETTQSTETVGTKLPVKILPLKLKCGSVDKPADKSLSVTQTSDKQFSGDAETTVKPVAKINRIKLFNKMKSEETQFEPLKPSVLKGASTDADKDQRTKKIIIKQPKGNVSLEQVRQLGDVGGEVKARKTKKMVEVWNADKKRKQEGKWAAEEAVKRKAKEEMRLWEEERWRDEERMREERNRRKFEEMERRMQEEQQRIAAEIRRYEEENRREREQRQKAKKKKKKKRTVEMRDAFLEEPRTSRSDRRIPERDRAAKRRPVVDLGRYAMDYGQQTKRRKGGEVVLSNILENIVESLKERYEISYLFLKPVSKKEAPDYLDIIENPMDLSTIREKVRRMEYKNREEFRHDVWQIAFNAHKYNDGRNPGIPPLADQVLEICDYMLEEHDLPLTEAESGIELRET